LLGLGKNVVSRKKTIAGIGDGPGPQDQPQDRIGVELSLAANIAKMAKIEIMRWDFRTCS